MAQRTWDAGVLRMPGFRRFAAARTISILGNAYGPLALSFGVLSVFHDRPVALSVVLAAQALPQVLLILFGGVLADRVSQLRMIVLAESLAALAWGALAIVIELRCAALWPATIAAAAAGTASALLNPALVGVVPQLVDDATLQTANSTLRVAGNSARILGLVTAGLTVAAFGPATALAFDALTFLVAGLIVSTLGLPRRQTVKTTTREDLIAGWHEFRSRQWLWVSVCQFTIVVAATNAYAGVFGPMVARQELGGPGAFSMLLMSQAVGAVAGAFAAIRVRPARPIFVAAALTPVLAAPMLFLAAGLPLPLVCVAAFAAGVTNDVYAVLWDTTVQLEVPRRALSRVSAFDLLGCTALAPLGLLAAGPIAAALGARTTAGLFGASIVLATGLALCAPGIYHRPGSSAEVPAGRLVPTGSSA